MFYAFPAAVFSFYQVVVPQGQGVRRLVVSSCRLPGSTLRPLWVDANLRQETLLLRLEKAFLHFGGVPRRLATRAVRPLGQPAADGESPAWNRSFVRFCAHFGCQPVAVPHNDPQDTDIREVAEDLVTRYRLRSLDQLQRALDDRCGGVRSDPSDLLPLPERPFVKAREAFRRVASDGFVTFAGDCYSVPIIYAGRSVWIRRSRGRILVYAEKGTCLASHAPGNGRGTVRLNPQHFEPARSRAETDLRLLSHLFLVRFPKYEAYVERLVAQRKLAAVDSLRAVLALTAIHSALDLDRGIEACLQYNNFSPRFLQGYLERAVPAPTDDGSDDRLPTQYNLF